MFDYVLTATAPAKRRTQKQAPWYRRFHLEIFAFAGKISLALPVIATSGGHLARDRNFDSGPPLKQIL
jgi:hypothetical protein